MRTFLLLAVVLGLALSACAQAPKGYICYRATNPVTIDGKLDDAAWKSAPWTDNFVDIEGSKKPAPRFQTHAKMLWDDQNFYIAATLEEPQVWATIAKRDDVIFHDNDFEVFMDPNGDNFEYGEFEINALNTGWDLFLNKPYKDNGHADDSWNIDGIKTAVFVNGTLNNPADTDSGWSVEIAMPWASLQRISHTAKPPQPAEQWRINFSRVEWLTTIVNGACKKVEGKPEDNWVWSPQAVINMHRPEMWGLVQFSTRAPGADSLRADPFADARRVLHELYYVEKEYYDRHQVWATQSPVPAGSPLPRVAATDSGFTITLDVGSAQAHIRQDSYFWIDSTKSR
ncbi:MAG TPA: carbohydrate-binding family 9-like protein [bacterium]|jgi:hypothetical protein